MIVAAIDGWGMHRSETTMNMKSISLAAAFALASTVALAQGNTTSTGSQKTDADKVNNSATTKPSPKDASTQGAGTAGAVDKKGDASSPGGTMKK
jgi:hypothetical protein